MTSMRIMVLRPIRRTGIFPQETSFQAAAPSAPASGGGDGGGGIFPALDGKGGSGEAAGPGDRRPAAAGAGRAVPVSGGLSARMRGHGLPGGRAGADGLHRVCIAPAAEGRLSAQQNSLFLWIFTDTAKEIPNGKRDTGMLTRPTSGCRKFISPVTGGSSKIKSFGWCANAAAIESFAFMPNVSYFFASPDTVNAFCPSSILLIQKGK